MAAEADLGAAATALGDDGAAGGVFTAEPLRGNAADLRVLLGGNAGAVFGVFNAEEGVGAGDLAVTLAAALAAVLVTALAAVLAPALTAFGAGTLAAGLTGTAGLTGALEAAALTLALTAVTLTVAF